MLSRATLITSAVLSSSASIPLLVIASWLFFAAALFSLFRASYQPRHEMETEWRENWRWNGKMLGEIHPERKHWADPLKSREVGTSDGMDACCRCTGRRVPMQLRDSLPSIVESSPIGMLVLNRALALAGLPSY
jgi:hypothetical protein